MGNFIFRCASRSNFSTNYITYICTYLYVSVCVRHMLFFETPANINLAGYANENPPYTYSPNIENVRGNLHEALDKIFH